MSDCSVERCFVISGRNCMHVTALLFSRHTLAQDNVTQREKI